MKTTEIVTEFKFKGDTKPLENAGKNMQKVSDNSGFASRRLDMARTSLANIANPTAIAAAGFAALGATLAKATQEVFKLGKEGSELRGLGINQGEFKQAQNLFVKLGSSMEDAGKFTREFAKAQNELSLEGGSAFNTALQDAFGVAIEEGETANDLLDKLREASQKMGLTAGQISVKAGELGFSPEFQKVLLATNEQFKEATRQSKELARTDEAMRENTEEAAQSMKELSLATKRLWERFSTGLAPAITGVVDGLSWFFEQLSITSNYIDDNLADALFDLWDGLKTLAWYIAKPLIDTFKMLTDGLEKMWGMVETHVFPVIQKMINVFYLLINSVRDAISNIPFVGDSVTGERLTAPQIFGSSSSVSNRTQNSVSNNNTNQTINVTGLTSEQINQLINASNQRNVSLAGASL